MSIYFEIALDMWHLKFHINRIKFKINEVQIKMTNIS